MRYLFILFTIHYSLFILLTGCQERSTTDAVEVHWDRDMCARCVMVVSDRHNTVQVREPKTGKTYLFDDIGCMVLWFHENNISWSNQATVWITDVTTGEWIDARSAFYDTENITPMAYGFSAHRHKETIKEGEEIIDFHEVTRRVINTLNQ